MSASPEREAFLAPRRSRRVRLPAALLALLALAGCVAPGDGAADAGGDAAAPVVYDSLTVETELGSFTAIVFCDETPATCAFMRGLVEGGYYDGRAFGRIIPGFVIQEVDRTGGTTDQPERVAGEFGTNVTFSAGAFGIARDADPDSGGSEFFVMDHPAASLWGNYTAFAQVVDGLDVVHAIARVPAVKTGPAPTVAASPPGSPVYFGVHDRVPVDPVVMTRVAWGETSLAGADAARYPLRIGDLYRSDTHRSSLEWPNDLRVGAPSTLVFYVWTRDTSELSSVRDPPAPDLAGVAVEVDGPQPSSVGELEADATNGVVRFAWTPPAPGLYQLRLVQGGSELGLGNVTIAG